MMRPQTATKRRDSIQKTTKAPVPPKDENGLMVSGTNSMNNLPRYQGLNYKIDPSPTTSKAKTNQIPSQPRQKKSTQVGQRVPSTNNRFGARNNSHTRKQDSGLGNYQVSGVSMSKSSFKNNDICDELILSKEGMRFDQKKKEAEERQKEKDDIMREAEAALAQTETMLQTRKDALMAKHVDGRESLNELDYVFAEPSKVSMGPVDEDNFLTQHRQAQMEEEKKIEDLRMKMAEKKNKRAEDLFKWEPTADPIYDMKSGRDPPNDFLNLNINSDHNQRGTPSARQDTGGVVQAARTQHGQDYSPDSAKFSDTEEKQEDLKAARLKLERLKMLEMIKNNKKMEMDQAPKEEAPQSKRRTERDILAGLGSGILKDLEVSPPKQNEMIINQEESPRETEEDINQQKKVTFAEESTVERSYDRQVNQQSRPGSQSSDGGPGTNKLAELNNLLKGGAFPFSDNTEEAAGGDPNDFAMFLEKLHQTRGGNMAPPVEKQESFRQEENKRVSPSQFYEQEEQKIQERHNQQVNSIQEDEEAEVTEQQNALDNLKRYEDDLDDILNMKPGNFRQNTQMVQKLESEPYLNKEREQIKKVVPALKQIADNRQVREDPIAPPQVKATPSGKSKKYDELMRYMEDIEEEMSSQYEKSSQRQRSNRHDVDPITEESSRSRAVAPYKPQNTADSILADIEESINSSQFDIPKQRLTSQPFSHQAAVEPREAYHKIREKMLELEIEREEQEKALDMLKEVRHREKEELNQAVTKAKEDGGAYADQVRQEMANRIEKQVQMIESLLEDKRELQDTMEKIHKRSLDDQSMADRQKKALEDKLQVELKRNREAWMASEKVRKEKWEKEKVQEIRAQTVKGLEPEIQRIVERNKDELRRAEERHQGELRQKKEEVILEQEKKFQDMREKLMRDKEEALDQEREKTQQKLHDQYERLEQQFNEERLRWKNNVYGEYDRLESMRKREKEALEEQLQHVQQRLEKEVDNKQLKYEERTQDLDRKQVAEIKRLKEEHQIAKESWIEQYQKKMDEQKQDFQKRIREEMVRERNREIEAIINKLGDETHDTQKQLMQQYERKVKDVENKWRDEVKEVQVGVNQWKDKFKSESDSRHMLDENLRVLGRRINDLEIDVQEKKDNIESLEREKFMQAEELAKIQSYQDGVKHEIEDEMRFKIDEKERDIRKLKEHIQNKEHQFTLEIEQLRTQNKNDLEMIQEKVQAAMGKKKDIIDALSEEIKLKDLQVVKLKEMLEKQRRELLQAH